MKMNPNNFNRAAVLAERAAELVGTEAELASQMEVLRYMEEIQIALQNQALAKVAHNRSSQAERLPLRCEGDDFGRIEARIPKHLAFSFMKQKNFGHDGFTSDEGMRDFLKAYPQYGVKTVTGKTTVGYRGQKTEGGRRKSVKFGRGVLNLAS